MVAASAPSATIVSGRAARWTGWALSELVMVFMAMDTAMKLADIAPVRQAAGQIGWPLALDRPLGMIDLVGLVLYAIPRTSALGAVYLTGLLGAPWPRTCVSAIHSSATCCSASTWA